VIDAANAPLASVVAVATLVPGDGPAVVRFAPAYCARG
jgi:hypothetical protein